MKLNDETVQQMFQRFTEEDDAALYCCYGTITATLGEQLLLGGLSALANQYFLLGFTNKKMVMIQLNMMSKPKSDATIPYDSFENVKISNWLFGLGRKITIKLNDGSKIRLKVNKHFIGIKKQKENLSAICNMLSNL